MKQLELMPNEQEAKNNFLLTNLKTIANKLNASELIQEIDGRYNYMQSAVEDFCQQTATELNFRANGTQIYIVSETSSYTVNVIGIKELIKDLESTLKIDWSKKTWSETKNSNENFATWKFVPINPNKSLKVKPELDTICQANLDSAKQGLENLTANYHFKDRAHYLKMQQKQIDYWSDMLKNHSYTEQELIEQELEAFIQNNPHFEVILGYLSGQELWMGKHRIKELFDKYSIEYTSDTEVFMYLYYADKINDPEGTYRAAWQNDFNDFDKYLNYIKILHKNKKTAYESEYLKKDGRLKSMSHRQRERSERDKMELDGINSEIDFIIKNEFKIKEFLNN